MKVIAIIGDVVQSRELASRAAFQQRLGATLRRVSRRGTGVASPYTITLGDEFQAVYRQPSVLWVDLVDILAAVHPVQVRVAIGVGSLATRLNPRQALGMDGPAFHRAREAMTNLKNGPSRFQIAGENAAEWKLINHLLALLSNELAGWSQMRLRILAGRLRGQAVRQMETELRISKVAIYKNINASALDDVVAICHEINRALVAELRR